MKLPHERMRYKIATYSMASAIVLSSASITVLSVLWALYAIQ